MLPPHLEIGVSLRPQTVQFCCPLILVLPAVGHGGLPLVHLLLLPIHLVRNFRPYDLLLYSTKCYCRMEADPSSPSRSKRCVCVCRRYCNGQPRLLSESTFYRHLANAKEDESINIKAARGMSIDAARLLVSNTATVNHASLNSKAGPSSHKISRTVQRTATLQGLAKRAREAPDAQWRVGKRKCAKHKENRPPKYVLC